MLNVLLAMNSLRTRCVTALCCVVLVGCQGNVETVNVGVMHSLSGTMADSERPVAMATLMAIEEINQAGGVLGYQIEPLLYDTQSDDQHAFRLAKKLLVDDQVNTVFGCWTSSCRKTIKPLFEQHDALLVYPVQFEGLEDSPNILYTGASASQQILPAISWGMSKLGHRVMFVGSDYIYPRVANRLARFKVEVGNGRVVDEVYFSLGDNDLQGLREKILDASPDFIFSTLNGSTNEAFFRVLETLPQAVAVVATSISEAEIHQQQTDIPLYVGHSYFEHLPGSVNQAFVKRFHAYAGENVVVSAAVVSAYTGVYLWAHAIEQSRSFHVGDVVSNLPSLSVAGVTDNVIVAIDSHYVWQRFYVAKFERDMGFNVIYTEQDLLPPNPYPPFLSKQRWESFLYSTYMEWGEQWQAPTKRQVVP